MGPPHSEVAVGVSVAVSVGVVSVAISSEVALGASSGESNQEWIVFTTESRESTEPPPLDSVDVAATAGAGPIMLKRNTMIRQTQALVFKCGFNADMEPSPIIDFFPGVTSRWVSPG